MRLPAELDARQGLALEGINDIVVPVENVYMQIAPLTHQGIEERTELVGVVAGRLIGPQPRPAVDVPGHDEDRVLRLLDSLGKGGKVGGSVNEERGARRRCNAPAVPSGYSYLMVGCERRPIRVTHMWPFSVARARAEALPGVPRHSLWAMFLAYRSLHCLVYRMQEWEMTHCANAKGSKFYAMVICLETGHAQQDGVW
jgi:hypothetical protein